MVVVGVAQSLHFFQLSTLQGTRLTSAQIAAPAAAGLVCVITTWPISSAFSNHVVEFY